MSLTEDAWACWSGAYNGSLCTSGCSCQVMNEEGEQDQFMPCMRQQSAERQIVTSSLHAGFKVFSSVTRKKTFKPVQKAIAQNARNYAFMKLLFMQFLKAIYCLF